MKKRNNKKAKRRIQYTIAFLLLFMIEVLIALFVHDQYIRPYFGDMLVVIVIYCAVRVIVLDKCTLLPVILFLFAAGVECLQYFNLVELLGLGEVKFIRILFGMTFDVKDIICYGVGCFLLFGYEKMIRKQKIC